uniref:hypothetical protein n=1 Tax=Caldicellulosiruptor kronotskyensis TaxID=413889 RepID=UPI001ED97C51|nr:hypothetical protein [Caldicellulosiruptor kronotskyensis]
MVKLCKEAGLPEPEFKEEGGFVVEFYQRSQQEDSIFCKMEMNCKRYDTIFFG